MLRRRHGERVERREDREREREIESRGGRDRLSAAEGGSAASWKAVVSGVHAIVLQNSQLTSTVLPASLVPPAFAAFASPHHPQLVCERMYIQLAEALAKRELSQLGGTPNGGNSEVRMTARRCHFGGTSLLPQLYIQSVDSPDSPHALPIPAYSSTSTSFQHLNAGAAKFGNMLVKQT